MKNETKLKHKRSIYEKEKDKEDEMRQKRNVVENELQNVQGAFDELCENVELVWFFQ